MFKALKLITYQAFSKKFFNTSFKKITMSIFILKDDQE